MKTSWATRMAAMNDCGGNSLRFGNVALPYIDDTDRCQTMANALF
jgi:hypothetical protein